MSEDISQGIALGVSSLGWHPKAMAESTEHPSHPAMGGMGHCRLFPTVPEPRVPRGCSPITGGPGPGTVSSVRHLLAVPQTARRKGGGSPGESLLSSDLFQTAKQGAGSPKAALSLWNRFISVNRHQWTLRKVGEKTECGAKGRTAVQCPQV